MSGDGPNGQRPRRRNPAGRSCQSVIAVWLAAGAAWWWVAAHPGASFDAALVVCDHVARVVGAHCP